MILAHFSRRAISNYANVGQVALPFASGLYSLRRKDYRGAGWLCIALIINQICIETLKSAIPVIRPNGGTRSFPSGHTAAAFLGPAFLVARYGFSVTSLPIALSILAATGVGIGRYLLRAHWLSDIFAGALLGWSVGHLVQRNN